MLEPPTKSADTPNDVEHLTDPAHDSMRALEFHLVRERLAGYTAFPPARELALEIAPTSDMDEVVHRQQETAEARKFLDGGSTIDLSEARDLRQALTRAGLGGLLTGEELRDAHDTLKAGHEARAALLRHTELPMLGVLARELPLMRDMEKKLASAIGRSGEVLDGANPGLRALREETRQSYQHLTDALERTIRRLQRQNVLQEPIITQRNGRMVVLVKAEMKHRLPGIVHDVSDSGATIFVEPMSTIRLGNQWRELRLAEEREEERVIRDLSARVEAYSSDLLRGQEALAQLGLAMAKAAYSLATRSAAPTVVQTDRQLISLVEARHPLLEGETVPISMKVGGKRPVLLITGPNAGGKTVALKTIGLLTLMVQSGLHVPAREATLSVFDGVYADIGDQQSIQRSLSTFSSHIQNLKAIIDRSTDRSLALIDELGTSTDPEEGAALVKAILRHFSQRNVLLVATTHQRDVAAFVQEQPGMMNASVELDPVTLAPTYRLSMGLPGRSYALNIASRLGLDSDIVESARSHLSPAHQRAENLMKELQEERHLAEEKHRAAESALAQAEMSKAELEEHLSNVHDRTAEMVEEARHQVMQRVEEMMRRLREVERATARPVPQTPDAPAPSEIKQARKELTRVRKELKSPEWQPPPSDRGDWLGRLQPRDRVYLRGIPRAVEVITPPGDEGTVEVLLGTMRARLPVSQIDRPAPDQTTPSGEGISYIRSSHRPAETQLDLRGVRVEEGLERVETFLNEAAVAGLSSVRIIHGMGTGALRSAIREHLSNHPLVKSAGRDDDSHNDGATIVELV